MTLKYKLKTLDGVDEKVKPLYKEVDGEFILQIDGMPPPPEDKTTDLEKVKNKNSELLDELKKFKKDKKDLEDDQKRKDDEANKKSGNFEALYKSAQEKITEKETAIQKMLAQNNDRMVDSTVMSLAAKLCDGSNVNLIKPHLRSRLSVNEEGNLQVLDSTGKPSVMTQDELVNEFQSNKDFAPLVRGTGSSGGGAPGGSSASGGVPNLYDMKPEARLAYLREHPELAKPSGQ